MNLREIINEAIKTPKNGKGIIVFDIDDTLLNAKNLRIRDGNKELTPTEFAQLSTEEKEGKNWDFSDFRNFNKLFDSIITGTPLTNNLRILDAHYNVGWDIGFLTARGVEKANELAIKQWLKIRNKINNKLEPIKSTRIKFFVAVNDPKRIKQIDKDNIKGSAEAKKYFLQQLTKKYGKENVKFVDDDLSFINAAKEVLLPKNVIKAQ